MKLILQTDPRLCTEINKWGCNLRSIIAIAEMEAKSALSPELIQSCYDWSVHDAIDPDCTVNKPDKILNWALSLLLPGVIGNQIGSIKPHALFAFWGWTRHYTILKGITAHGFHFRLGNNEGRLIFDPMPGVTIIDEADVLVYRLLTV